MTEKKALDIYMFIFLCSIGIFEAGHLAGVFGKLSISDCGRIIAVMMIAAVGLSLIGIFVFWRRKGMECVRKAERKNGKRGQLWIPGAVLVLLLAMQIYGVFSTYMPETPGDIMQETVNSFLATDEIYSVSPLTGKAFGGVPMRYEILCLPTMYTLLCRWFGILPEVLLKKVVPIVVMCTSYMAYYLLGGRLFGKEEDGEKRLWFVVFVALIFCLCEKMPYMEGYGILHGGYMGTTIRNSILVPLTIYALLGKKWLLTGLCVLTEVCIAWTLWGLGVCTAVAAGMLVMDAICRKRIIRDFIVRRMYREEE